MTAVEADRSRGITRRLLASEPVHGEIANFLVDEAALLDEDRQREWLDLLTDDVHYHMPIRRLRYRKDGSGFDSPNAYFNDDRAMLGVRVCRNVEIAHAYDRDPPPRTRRFVTNVAAHETVTEGEYAVSSSVLLTWSRFRETGIQMLSAGRADVLRRVSGELRLARRLILPDQTEVGAVFNNVFL